MGHHSTPFALCGLCGPRRYLSDHPDNVLDNFFSQIDAWEATTVTDALRTSQGNSDSLPSTIVYHVLSNAALLQNPSIFEAIKFSINSGFRVPSAPFPSSVILLLTDSRIDVQSLADHLRESFQPIGEPAQASVALVNALLQRLSGRAAAKTSHIPLWDTTLSAPQLWSALPGVLQLFSSSSIQAHFVGKNAEVNLKRIVIGNLDSASSE